MTLGATSRLTKISASLYEEFFGTLVANILVGVRKQMETKRKILNSISEEKRKFIMVKSHGIALMFGFGSLSTGRSCCQAVVLCSRVLFHSLALLLQLASVMQLLVSFQPFSSILLPRLRKHNLIFCF